MAFEPIIPEKSASRRAIRLELRLDQIPGGTKLSLRHRAMGFIDAAHREGVGQGWQHYLDSIRKDFGDGAACPSSQIAGDLDGVWKASSDPTRRAMLGPSSRFTNDGSAATKNSGRTNCSVSRKIFRRVVARNAPRQTNPKTNMPADSSAATNL